VNLNFYWKAEKEIIQTHAAISNINFLLLKNGRDIWLKDFWLQKMDNCDFLKKLRKIFLEGINFLNFLFYLSSNLFDWKWDAYATVN
jgi:hypothetical protein